MKFQERLVFMSSNNGVTNGRLIKRIKNTMNYSILNTYVPYSVWMQEQCNIFKIKISKKTIPSEKSRLWETILNIDIPAREDEISIHTGYC